MNLWILTEERPKINVLSIILDYFIKDKSFTSFIDNIRILPILENGKFCFTYELMGIRCNNINKIYIKIVSGNSSFVDFLIFYQNNEPNTRDIPLYAIEETKTDDSESRNTSAGQRISKFVILDIFYPNIKKIMLYNFKIEEKINPTDSNIFGIRLLLTLGVNILGKNISKDVFKPFLSVDELIEFKSKMRKPPKGNIPIEILKEGDCIRISGRLVKNNSISHDPNIGILSGISAVLRKLGYTNDIIIIEHGLIQSYVKNNNKFIKIANSLNILLDKLTLSNVIADDNTKYWKYETKGEKLGTIFIHITIENFTNGWSIFENHAGCEKGYFITKDKKYISLEKYTNREEYKTGDKSKIYHIPDLIIFDVNRKEIINIEGKTYKNRFIGISELNNYNAIENDYIKKYYPESKIIRTVVLYGSTDTEIIEIEVSFLLNENGLLILGKNPPSIFKEAIKNLLDFWSKQC